MPGLNTPLPALLPIYEKAARSQQNRTPRWVGRWVGARPRGGSNLDDCDTLGFCYRRRQRAPHLDARERNHRMPSPVLRPGGGFRPQTIANTVVGFVTTSAMREPPRPAKVRDVVECRRFGFPLCDLSSSRRKLAGLSSKSSDSPPRLDDLSRTRRCQRLLDEATYGSYAQGVSPLFC